MERTRLICSAAHFKTIVSHPLLPPALQLARAVNALRSLITAAVPSSVIPKVLRLRQSTNALLYLGATLYEALEVLDHLGPDMAALGSVRDHLLPLKRDKDLRAFKQDVLWPLRKAVVFHFDQDVVPRSFPTLAFDPTVFCSWYEANDGFYELADFALIPAAFEDGAYGSFVDNYMRFLNDTVVHTGYFCRAADKALVEVAELLGFAPAPLPSPDESIQTGA